ncbi:UDP-glucose 4-epimerase [Sphaeroforma arctica JP610]|uniref:UDP-glucose 4-epimerase n=1 Tax=Sphaeroforma arctica JP610 TaxID=667725 RepID=A0A0L0FTE5_9EUKA|nr:UDP-glucose 4-epimerase [Sphaeroforma arctica JP610]KNC79841.1 UDP-glucose 4-epimerase [Sphaeroforma arctica JP610]|eukprot:XP_014153743.1 UDP-glucose 4-epimerase [Sphaeroforma arctica JP610]
MTILVAGGAGYIGSHTVVELLTKGEDVVVVDNLLNSKEESLKRVEKITGKPVKFVKCDLLDSEGLDKVFAEYKPTCVIHFAGLKAVGESVAKPIWYYHNNITGTLIMVEIMKKYNCKNIIFSSSATVYGMPQYLPLDEDHPLSCTNPYGRTKLFIEDILRDLYISDNEWNIVLLRYFNPTGAHSSGTIGEDPSGVPSNLMPYVAQTAVGRREHVNVFGGDYDTPDGTGVRDYIHVVDLAKGHVAAHDRIKEKCGCKVYNLGTGKGYSVVDMIKAFEKACGRDIKYVVGPRRPGDVGSCYAKPDLAASDLKWTAQLGLDEMCADMWRWQQMNPNGFN